MPTDMGATRFGISVDGYQLGAFRHLGGLKVEQDVVEYIPSRELETVFLNRYAGVRKTISVRLVRPRSTSMDLWAWHEAARMNPGKASRKVTLQLFEGADKPVARYHLENTWPSKIEIGGLKAGEGASLLETVTLSCEFIQRVR